MKREWRQANPRDQLVAVIGATWGHISNIEEGIYKPEKLPEIYRRLDDLFEQMNELTKMVSGEWPPGHNPDKEPDTK